MPEQATIGIVLDCADPDKLANFWAAALGYTHLGTFENYAMLAPESKPGPKLLLQQVPEPKAGKNRMHFDIETPSVDAEAARLETLGATRISDEAVEEHGNRWIVMADPEGNEFCVCNAGQGG